VNGPRAAVIDAYDAALFDLDGVVYLGPVAVVGAAEGIARLRERGTKVGFVTNNAARSPAAVAEHLRELAVPATTADVVTSAQAGAHLVVNRFGAGAKVLIVGGSGVAEAIAEAGDGRRPLGRRRAGGGFAGLRLRPHLAAVERGGDRHSPRRVLGGHQH
jgi:ribonucleotide monophosphatase NagD (HAD superfamily)